MGGTSTWTQVNVPTSADLLDIDFADNNARAVICLGIPFPNIKEAQVNLKMVVVTPYLPPVTPFLWLVSGPVNSKPSLL